MKYFKVLVCCNWEKRVQKTCRVATPVTFNEFIGRICLHQSQLSGHAAKNNLDSLSNDHECSICDNSNCSGIRSTQLKSINTRFHTLSYRSLLWEGFLLNLCVEIYTRTLTISSPNVE